MKSKNNIQSFTFVVKIDFFQISKDIIKNL